MLTCADVFSNGVAQSGETSGKAIPYGAQPGFDRTVSRAGISLPCARDAFVCLADSALDISERLTGIPSLSAAQLGPKRSQSRGDVCGSFSAVRQALAASLRSASYKAALNAVSAHPDIENPVAYVVCALVYPPDCSESNILRAAARSS